MSEIQTTNVCYSNCLLGANRDQQIAYINATQRAIDLDAQIITECSRPLFQSLEQEYENVTFETGVIYESDIESGFCVIGKTDLDVKRISPWQAVDYRGFIGAQVYDKREMIRFELCAGSVGSVAIFGSHNSHYHHLTNPGFALRRKTEWEEQKKELASEELPFLWLADTNTFFAKTVRNKLGLQAIGADLIDHQGGRTWGYYYSRSPRMLYLDRAVACKKLLPLTTLATLPRKINGVANPSDHRSIVASIAV